MNRLAGEVSPYLVQHAANPVHWWPWCDAAFAESRATGKPILLSIGYSACHWCHVMAHESFEDNETAALMNELFVNIKVDREERPDVDHVYMTALQALGQQGGWPLTMFLRPDRKPFWGGTYFPRTARHGQPAFASVLRSVAAAFHNQKTDIDSNAAALTDALKRKPEAAQVPDLTWIDQIATRIADRYDPQNGGLQGAPKFPNPPVLELLWRAADRTGTESLRKPVLLTLERMVRGGIYDHVGGGFARYSVDDRWLVPHFEKMLYDNGQLLGLLGLAHQRTAAPLLNTALRQTMDWLSRDMKTAEGAFAASFDADSADASGHMHEGAFYVWTPDEIAEVLAGDAPSYLAAYDITRHGNFEGRSIPNRLSSNGLDDDLGLYERQNEQLRKARSSRPSPARDDKVLADWNGLAITALARIGATSQMPVALEMAQQVFAAVVASNERDSQLKHATRLDRSVPAQASDYASMALAALALAETGDVAYLTYATRWCRNLRERFTTESGVIAMVDPESMTSDAGLPVRPAPTHDDAVPNANAMAAEAYARLFAATGDSNWLDAADDLFTACAGAIRANPFGHAALLNALDLRLRRADVAYTTETAAVGKIRQEVSVTNRTMRRTTDLPAGTMTICSATGDCSLPITDPDEALARVRELLSPQS